MLEVIIDTNIIIRAILKQRENDDCWEVLHLLRKGEICAVTSKELESEYILAPYLVAFNALEEHFGKNGYDELLLQKSKKDCIDCSNAIAEITSRSRKVIVTSRLHACPTDADDNKLVDLAYDSNCHIIITRNRSDFMYAEEKGIKTKNGDVIQFYEPALFLKCHELTKRNEVKINQKRKIKP